MTTKENKNKHKIVHHKTIKRSHSKMNYWMIGSVILAILLVLSIATHGFETKIGKVSAKESSLNAINLITQGQADAAIHDVKFENGLYSMNIIIQGQEITSYITKDGKVFFPQGIDLSQFENENTAPEQETAQEVPKSDKPEVELFVMSYCPYGTQSEKGMLPVVDALGDKIDFKIKFVYYVMHGEKELKEQMNQVCIEDEQNDKYLDYLSCFLKDGNSGLCMDKIGVDKTALSSCVKDIDSEYKITEKFNDKTTWLSGNFPLFDVYKTENEKYKVGGSPTLVINGQQVSSGRSPAAYLAAICSAFEDAPKECSTLELSADTPAPGFGYEGTGSDEGVCA